MSVKLIRIDISEAEKFWKIQVAAFSELLEKYRDTETSPAAESIDKVNARFLQPFTYYYYILDDDITVGGIRVVDRKDGTPKRISPIFIMPGFRNHGYAQAAIRKAEELHGAHNWALDTILQETTNCHLYEKMGYRQTGTCKVINDRMTLVVYAKN